MKNLYCFLILLTLTSCFTDENKIRIKTQFISDSLYVSALKGMDLYADSICIQMKNASLTPMIDSLIQLRKEEIINLRKGL